MREPAKNVSLAPQTPKLIVLGLEPSWVEVRVVDDNEKPISAKKARLHLTDGRVVEQLLGADALVGAEEIPAGVCKFVLPVQDRADWVDPSAPAPTEDPKDLPEGHWIVRKKIKPPGPEVPNLRTGETHTVVVGRKIAEQLEIDDALFRLMSAVLLPEAQNPDAAPTEPDGTRPTAMDLLAASLRFAQLHPDRKILITGHTDTSGGDAYNQELSKYRAGVVYAVLANEKDVSRQEFGRLCHGPHLQGKEKKQQVLYDDRVQVLNWVAATFGWGCSTDGEYWSYLKAVEAFQSTYNTEGNNRDPKEQLSVDGDFGPATWRGVFDCYQVHLAETLETTMVKLEQLQGEVRGRFLKPFMGCGENKPKEMAGMDNYRSQTNRRVEVLFFEQGDHEPEVPCLGGECEAAGCELYERAWYLRKRLRVDSSTAETKYRIHLHDHLSNPMDGRSVPFRLSVTGTTGAVETTTTGWVEFATRHGQCALVRLEWGDLLSDGSFPYQRDLALDCDQGPEREQARAKLHNLGYGIPSDTALEAAVEAFQRDYGIKETGMEPDGSLKPLTRERLAEINDNDRCDATRRC